MTLPRAQESMREVNQAQSSYHPRGYGNSMGYRRARKPYLVGNLLTFAALSAFVVGVYTYSIVMVEQDDFSDIENIRVQPNEERTPPSAPPTPMPAPTEVAKEALPAPGRAVPAAPAPDSFSRAPPPAAKAPAVSSTSAIAAPVMNKKLI